MTVEIDRNFHDHATDRKRLDFYTAENTVPASSGITGGDFQDTDLSADAPDNSLAPGSSQPNPTASPSRG